MGDTMAREENIVFFEQVKGKKIRWNAWPKTMYVVPVRLTPSGLIFDTEYTSYYIYNGFKSSYCGFRWEFYETTQNIILKSDVKNIICECGAEKCNSNHHSDWCPKYRRLECK